MSAWLAEFCRVAAVLPRIEWERHASGTAQLIERLRASSGRRLTRDPLGRARLRRVIAAVDARLPGQPSCYRRALIEMALDGGAAREPLNLGLRVPGGLRSGHAWLGGTSDEPAVVYDVQISL